MADRRTNLTHATHDPTRGAWRSTCAPCGFKILARTKQALLEHQADHDGYQRAVELAAAVVTASVGDE